MRFFFINPSLIHVSGRRNRGFKLRILVGIFFYSFTDILNIFK